MRYDELARLADVHGSPFYLFDRAAFVANLKDMREAFEARYPSVVIGYSYKTNHLPDLCSIARDNGAWAEVVSRLELDLALALGCQGEQIIFNGPLKRDEDLELALREGVLVNADSMREVDFLERFAAESGRSIRVGLRINVPLIDDDGVSHLQEGVPVGRFGLQLGEVADVAARLEGNAAVRVVSLHGHVSSTSRSEWVYRKIVRTLADAAETLFPDTIEYLNVGGGFFGRRVPEMGFVDSPTYSDYAEAIGEEMAAHRWVQRAHPTLVVEPGMAVTADTMSFVTRVFEVKHLGDRTLAMVDGTLFNVRPTMHRRNLPFVPVRREETDGGRQTYTVVGSTCMEKDRLLEDIECGELSRDDFVVIGNVGAYGHVLTPPFIQPAPAILAREGAEYVEVRRRQRFEDFYATYDIPSLEA